MNAVLVVDKPAGMTSHDVVNRVRRILGQRSVGHLGTLDPAATGVLPLVLGSLTRLSQFYGASEKQYEGWIRFGQATDTYDAEGIPVGPPQTARFTAEKLEAATSRFRGSIQQMPPAFSAKKVQGVPAYKLARKKKDVELTAVEVNIHEFRILEFTGERARFHARVSSGTYMRSIAHDLGQMLGCGAHLESLRRTAHGEFTLNDAHTLEAIQAGVLNNEREVLFIHPRKLLPQLPSVTATPEQIARIRAGRTVNLPELSRSHQVKVFQGQSDLIAIVTRMAGTLFHPKIVLAPEAESVAQSD